MRNEFVTVEKWGKLYIDKILFEAGYPVLFVCRNDKRDLFICVCCQNNEQGTKWLMSRAAAKQIAALLKNEITIRELFLYDEKERYSINAFGNKIEIIKNDKNDWAENSIYLPKENEYMDAEAGEFEEEILYYEAFDLKYDSDVKEYVRYDIYRSSSENRMELYAYDNEGINYEKGMDVLANGIIKVHILVKNLRLAENGFVKRMLLYSQYGIQQNEKITNYKYMPHQIVYYDIKSGIETDLLDAA